MRWLPIFLTIACTAGGCATRPPPTGTAQTPSNDQGPWSYRCASELPADLCAAIVAGAVRVALPFCDAEPRYAGALATATGGAFEIAVGRDAHAYRMLGDTRLHVAAARCDGRPLPTVRCEPMRSAGGKAAADVRLRLLVCADGAGSLIQGTFAHELRGRVQPQLERALRAAAAPTNAPGNIEDPALARLIAHRLLACTAQAAASGMLDQATPWLLNALTLGADTPQTHLWLAELAHRRGRADEARQHRWQAMLGSADARQRAELARTLGALPAQDDPGEALLRAARAALAQGRQAAAADLLHSARRVGAAPARDYRLQQRLSRLRGDNLAALANALLAREHAPWRPLGTDLADDLRAAGLARLGDLNERRIAGTAAKPQ